MKLKGSIIVLSGGGGGCHTNAFIILSLVVSQSLRTLGLDHCNFIVRNYSGHKSMDNSFYSDIVFSNYKSSC